MQVDKPLLASHIMQVCTLKGGEIFLLKGWDGSSLVLKAEPQVTGDKIKKAIDVSIKMKPHMGLLCYTDQRRQVQVGRLQDA